MNAIARFYLLNKQPEKSKTHYKFALRGFEASHNHRWAAYSLSQLAQGYIGSGDYEQGIELAHKGLKLAKKYDLKKEISDNYEVLGEIYAQLGDNKKSQFYIKSYRAIHDSIFNKENIAQIEMLQLSFKAAAKEKEVEQLKARQELSNLRITNETLYKNLGIGGFLLSMIFVIFLLVYVRSRNRTNKKLELQKNELEKIYQDRKLLSEIADKINKHLSVDAIAESLYAELNQIMDADVFGIGMYSEHVNGIVFKGAYEEGKTLKDFTFSLTKDNVATKCFKSSTEIVIADWELEHTKYVGGEYKIKEGKVPVSLVYLPLISAKKTIGVVTVQSFQKNSYSEHDIDILRNVVSYLAKSLENAQLHEDLQKTVKRRTKEISFQNEEIEHHLDNSKLLSKIGQQITSTLNFESVFEKLHENVNLLMDAEIFGVRIYDKESNTVDYKYELESGKRHPAEKISMDDKDNYSVWCITNREQLHINDNLAEYSKYVKEIKVVAGKMPISLLFSPMIVGDKVVGVITVQSLKPNAYTKNQMHMLNTLASYTGIALDNAALYENLEEKVLTRTKELDKQKEELTESNRNMTDSIKYAQLIQSGLMTPDRFMKQLLPQSFAMFKPKDIVSGDFYWVDRKDGKIIVAVVDCTGHGVPGAFMSIVSTNLLNQAVNEKGLTTPSLIFDYMQLQLTLTFKNDDASIQGVNDGMDIALYSVDFKNGKIVFAGAHNPLYFVRNNELSIIPGNRHGISAQANGEANRFEDKELDIKKGDSIYIFSDGYPDQYGGKNDRKFGYSRFREMLLEISEKDMSDQKDILIQRIDKWMGEEEQIDDICVVGIRI